MDSLSEVDIEKIREYWVSYYRISDLLERSHAQLHNLEMKIRDDSTKYFDINKFKSIEDYLSQRINTLMLFKSMLEVFDESIKDKQSYQEELQRDFEGLLRDLNLQQEERSYDEDLYNLVNGLEDDSIYMRTSDEE